MCPNIRARRELATSDRIWPNANGQQARTRSVDPSRTTTTTMAIDNNNNNNNNAKLGADDEGSCESWPRVDQMNESPSRPALGIKNTRHHHCPPPGRRVCCSLLSMNVDQQLAATPSLSPFNCTSLKQRQPQCLSSSTITLTPTTTMFSLSCDLASIKTSETASDQRRVSEPSSVGDQGGDKGELVSVLDEDDRRSRNQIGARPPLHHCRVLLSARQGLVRHSGLVVVFAAAAIERQPQFENKSRILQVEEDRVQTVNRKKNCEYRTRNNQLQALGVMIGSPFRHCRHGTAASRRPQLDHSPSSRSSSIATTLKEQLVVVTPRPRRLSSKLTPTTSCPSLESKKLFLAFMMPTLALSLLVLASTGPQLARADPSTGQQQHRQQMDTSQQHADLLQAEAPPYAPTRRPSGVQILYGTPHKQPTTTTTYYSDRDRSIMMPNEVSPVLASDQRSNNNHNNNNNEDEANPNSDKNNNNGQPAIVHDGASSMESPKFTRTNELEAFLDDMNHRELQTVASGRPIEDLFQPKPFDMTPVASHSQQPKPRARGEGATDSNEAESGRRLADRSPKTGTGLMGSHSEQQIYSDCALILQRTYVKNMEDSKHQLVPFGKTEQACISYKHIDKAIEQAKHKLKFREFVKMRKKPLQNGASGSPSSQAASAPPPPPPPSLEVLHTSLEPPEDLVAAIGEINMAATQIIADQFDLSNDELLNGLPLIDMSKTKFASICPLLVRQDLKCELTRFRTFTAHCNNLKHPTWGAAKTPYARYLPPVHPDGIWVPRKSIVSEITFDLGIGHRETHTDFSPSMPLPAIHKDEAESHGHQHFPTSSTTSLLEEGGGSPMNGAPMPGAHHRFGNAPAFNSIEEPNVSELESQADAELLREAHDDGTHMDMASSVTFARHAHPDNNNYLESPMADQIRFPGSGTPMPGAPLPDTTPAALMHHHHRLVSVSAAAAQAHHQHMSPPPPPPPMPPGHNPAGMPSLPAPIIHRPHKSRSIPQELPSARLVSSIVHRDADIPNHEFSMLFLSWGQLLDHDMTRAATPPQTIKCCPSANGEPPAKHKLCLPIKVPPNDPFYSKFGVQCLEFRRTLAGVRPNCVLGPRVHQNANTAPIDANFVYGSAQATADSLRLFKGGRLRDRDWFRAEGLKPLLPAQEIDPDLNCLGRPKDLFCFLAGDVRVNEQTHLTVLHTLYMREHNRIADKLSELNPHWDDERTFQETRHLVAAGVQHVLINEYIPLLIGRKMTELYNLTVSAPSHALAHHHPHHNRQLHHQSGGYWHGYDPTVTTSVSNSFAAAAFRQGHTFVQSTIDRFNKFHEFVTSEKLRHLFMQPFLLYQPGVMDELVGGMINRQSQSYDPFMTEELAGHLFQPPEAEFGQDLASINLQRGRDQGLPGYNLFREWCGLPRAETFEQLEPYLTNRTAYLYSKLYKHVDDIDLWSAGISERKLPGAAIGPTFSCIIARQFSNTRRGDRFWYENPGLPSSFTPDQLAEIKKITLAKLLCTNADDLPTIQRWAFRMAHPVLNPRVDCSQLPDIDLQYWQEE